METRLEPIQKNDVNSKQILRAALVVLACMNLQFGLEQNQPQSLLHDQWWCNLLTTKMLLIKKPYFYVIVVLAHLYQPVLIIVDIWIATVHTIHNMLPLRFPFKSFKKSSNPSKFYHDFRGL